jgi:hypothetical protein
MKIHWFLFLAFIVVGCSYFNPPPPKLPPDNREEVTWVVEKIMAKWRYMPHKRLRLEHAYVYYNEKFTGLRLEISSQEILEVREARDLLVDFTEDILRELNTDSAISSQLAMGVIEAANLNIEINFESYFQQVDPYYVGTIKLKKGMVYYYAFDVKSKGWYAWHSRVEPYDKTREISLIERAVAEDYQKEHSYGNFLDTAEGPFLPMDSEEFNKPSPERKF